MTFKIHLLGAYPTLNPRLFPGLWIFLLLSFPNHAQKKISPKKDSLKRLIKTLPNDSNKVKTLHQLGHIYTKSSDFKQAIQVGKKALKLSQRIQFIRGIYQSHFEIGTNERFLEKHSQAIEHLSKAINYFEHNNQPKMWGKSLRELGINHAQQGDNVQALKFFLKALKIFEKNGSPNDVGNMLTAIGIIHARQKDLPQAIHYYKKALSIYISTKTKIRQAACYINLGNAYNKQGLSDSALIYCHKALTLSREIDNTHNTAITLTNIGAIYISKKQYPQAIQYNLESLQILDSLGVTGKTIPLMRLGEAYAGLKEFGKSIDFLKKAEKIARQHKQRPNLVMILQKLANSEEQVGNYQTALQYYKQYKQYQDSLFNEKNTKKITQLTDEYRFSKERDSLKFAQQKQQMALKTQINTGKAEQKTTYIGLGLTLLLLITLGIFYRFKQRNHRRLFIANERLAHANGLLQEQNAEISAQHDAIEAQNTQLFLANHKINQSIRAAKVIQSAVLPFEERLQKHFQDYFVLFRPRDIVSGDFYWVSQIEDQVVLVTADCTGHGVPGAFMSLISLMMLNQIVNTQKITAPQQILTQLQQDTLQALKCKNNPTPGGLDAAVVSIQPSSSSEASLKVNFAGAKRPLWLLTPDQSNIQELKGSRISIGVIYRHPRYFIQHELELEKGTLLYLGSDGLEDQHNQENEKFGTQNLLDLLLQNRQRPLVQQQPIIENALLQHMQTESQRDDILLMGIRL